MDLKKVINNIIGVIWALTLFTSGHGYSQTESLIEILEFVENICGEIPINEEGRITRKEISTKISVDLGGIFKVIGAKARADGTYVDNEEKWVGTLLKDVPEELKDARDCRITLVEKIIEQRRLIEQKKTQPKRYIFVVNVSRVMQSLDLATPCDITLKLKNLSGGKDWISETASHVYGEHIFTVPKNLLPGTYQPYLLWESHTNEEFRISYSIKENGAKILRVSMEYPQYTKKTSYNNGIITIDKVLEIGQE